MDHSPCNLTSLYPSCDLSSSLILTYGVPLFGLAYFYFCLHFIAIAMEICAFILADENGEEVLSRLLQLVLGAALLSKSNKSEPSVTFSLFLSFLSFRN